MDELKRKLKELREEAETLAQSMECHYMDGVVGNIDLALGGIEDCQHKHAGGCT